MTNARDETAEAIPTNRKEKKEKCITESEGEATERNVQHTSKGILSRFGEITKDKAGKG